MRWALLLAVLSAVLFPAPANAARVEVGDHVPGVLPALFVLDPGHFDGGAEDEVNDVTLTLAADGRVEITDAASPVDARNGCESIDEHRARCPAAGIASISVQLGALDDSYRGGLPAGFYVSVYTGTGDDTLIGGPANEILDGGPGAEEIRGGDGNDSHNATVLFDAPNVGARITLDGLPDDGLPGEGDNVFPDVEDIGGTPGPDTIIATAGHNTITGGGGDDVLQGMGGNDRINGSGTLSGGPGDDHLRSAGNGRVDTVLCGGGQDWAEVDATDLVAPDCSSRYVPGLPFSNMAEPQPVIAPAPARARRSRYAPVLLACPPGAGGGACRGELTLTRSKRVGKRAFRVPRGRIVTLRVPLTKYGRGLLARKRSVRLVAQIRTASGRRELPVVVRTRRR